jgi:hypothetical protein
VREQRALQSEKLRTFALPVEMWGGKRGLDKAKNFVPLCSLKRGEAGGGADDSGARLVVRCGMIFEKWQGGGGARRYL